MNAIDPPVAANLRLSSPPSGDAVVAASEDLTPPPPQRPQVASRVRATKAKVVAPVLRYCATTICEGLQGPRRFFLLGRPNPSVRPSLTTL